MRKQKHPPGWRTFKLVLQLIGAGFVVLAATTTVRAYTLIRDLPHPERLTQRTVAESTKIYDRTGKVLLFEIYGEERRTVIPLHEVPEHVKWTAIVTEDINFYDHIGVDIRGILRAILRDLKSGSFSQGGSTITQQLVKNSLLSSERTITRKFKEAILAVGVETKFSKDEILELYLNQIPYGSNAYGIAAAADTFFAKTVGELTIAESALLASLPKAPTYYSPYGDHVAELFQRKDWTIARMKEAGLIDDTTAETATKEPLVFAPPRRSIRAPHFVMFVRSQLTERYGEEMVERGGLKVLTTLDWKLQEAAERFVSEGAERNQALVKAKNAALVAIDPASGDILAMVGSRDYFDITNDGNVNVTIRPRQPGSAFKPFVYATAFKKGYTPETVLFDVPTEFNPQCNPDGSPGPRVTDPTQCYHPKNYDNVYRGPVTLRQALAQSRNVPSVKLLYLAGLNDSIETARAMGITTLTDPRRYGLSLVLGGAEVTLLEMTSAFGAFARDGILNPKTAVLSVTTGSGLMLEEKTAKPKTVLDAEVARTINDVLSDNAARIPVFSPTSSLYFPGRDVAAKTGTTQDYRDAWVVGYTPSLTAGVWVGNNDNTPMQQEGLSVMVAGPIWHQFMEFALAETPNEPFPKPQAGITTKLALRGGYRDGGVVQIDSVTKKRATEFTPPELVEEISIGAPRTILSFVDPNDPRGPSPKNPEVNPQFMNWEEALTRWNGLDIVRPPDAVDDVHTPENRPEVRIMDPETDGTAIRPGAEIRVFVKPSFPLKEVLFYLNGALAGSRTAPITTPEIVFPLGEDLAPGTYDLTVTAYDAVGNRNSSMRHVTVVRE